MTDPVVTRRIVYHIGGYDSVSPTSAYQRFARELRRFESTWSADAAVSSPATNDDVASWSIAASGPNWRVETEYRLVRWDDVIDADEKEPVWRQIPRALLAFVDFVQGGALWGYLRTNWRYACFFLYPYVILGLIAALAVFLGKASAERAGSPVLGLILGAAAFVILLTWSVRHLYLQQLFNDWIFSRTYVRHGHPVLDGRLERVARDLVAAAESDQADEILVTGHSLGAVLAIDLMDRALRLKPDLGETGPRIAILSIGSSILKIGLHRGAIRFRSAVEHVASARHVFWAEYQALTDVMNFYKIDPVAAMGLHAAGHPVIRTTRISRMLDPAFYRRIRRNFFRVHCQFVSGNDRRAAYDYFMLLCGPLYAESQVRYTDGAASAIGADGALLEFFPEAQPQYAAGAFP